MAISKFNSKYHNYCVCHKPKDKRAILCNSCARMGKLNHSFRGFTYLNGYKYIYSPNHPNKDVRNFVAEHVLVMEKSLGRYLTKDEEIHHKNNIRDDNRIKNLKLFKNHSEHMRHHRLQEIKNHTHLFQQLGYMKG